MNTRGNCHWSSHTPYATIWVMHLHNFLFLSVFRLMRVQPVDCKLHWSLLDLSVTPSCTTPHQVGNSSGIEIKIVSYQDENFVLFPWKECEGFRERDHNIIKKRQRWRVYITMIMENADNDLRMYWTSQMCMNLEYSEIKNGNNGRTFLKGKQM